MMICFPQAEYYTKISNLVNVQTNTADSFLEFSNFCYGTITEVHQ